MAEFLKRERQRLERARIQKAINAQAEKDAQTVAAELPTIFQKLRIALGKAVQEYNSEGLGSSITIEEPAQNRWIARVFAEGALHGQVSLSYSDGSGITYSVNDTGISRPLSVKKQGDRTLIEIGRETALASEIDRVAFYLLQPLVDRPR